MAYKNVTCPKCGGEAKAIDAVMNTDSNEKYRRKRCAACGYDFYTIEFEVEADSSFLENWYHYHRETNRVRDRRKRK